MDNVLERALNALNNVDYYMKELHYKQSKMYDCQANIMVLNHKKDIILAAKEYHKKAIDILYKNSIKDLEELINDVVSAIFYDRNLRIKMELSDSRSKSLTWSVINEDLGVEMSVKNGIGRGVRVVLSFILQSYYLLSFGSKFMFIDEGYSFISEAYIEKFFEFVKLLCKEKGLTLVMISHDDRFSAYANKNYHIIAGTIAKVVNKGD